MCGDVVVRYEKGCEDPPPDMRFIDYGLSAVHGNLVRELIAPGEQHDLADFSDPQPATPAGCLCSDRALL